MTEEKVEAIKASDLMALMDVVQAAVGLYNVIEREEDPRADWEALGEKLRALGLMEV